MTTTFGLFQVAYQGSPMSSFTDVGCRMAVPPSKPRTSLAVASGSTSHGAHTGPSRLAIPIAAVRLGSPRPISTFNMRSR